MDWFALLWVCLGVATLAADKTQTPAFRAGAFAVDIAPEAFPVRVNGMFTERSADSIVDPLFVKALALDDGTKRIVICVVDTCMIPRDLIDRAKMEASRVTGIPVESMLVSATHTHSAPSAMGCLGSRVDPRYAAYLPGRIAASIIGAVKRIEPARVGWIQADVWEGTFNRRWIRRPDRIQSDPFGALTVRANMHPGHESPDAVGPSGPVDPQLSVVAVQRMDGRSLAILANYSMHYIGSPMLSSDYFGRFADHLTGLIEADSECVVLFSQGTSGDLYGADYGGPRREIAYDPYAKEMAGRVAGMLSEVVWHDDALLGVATRNIELGYRTPDAARLEWAQDMVTKVGDRLPQSLPEVYAYESLYLHEGKKRELVLQAMRIGDVGITAIPNEVYALTGLKLKRFSPLPVTFNVTLANGSEGYIPPAEQHVFGGYTTWPARTAGLEVDAEARIVDSLVELLELASGQKRRSLEDGVGAYVEAVMESEPMAYWRLEEMTGGSARDRVSERYNAIIEPGVAVYLSGVDDRTGHLPAEPPSINAFSGTQINRGFHFAGGRLRAEPEEQALRRGSDYSVGMWVWNGLPADARPVTGYVYSRGVEGDEVARGEHLGIGGTVRADLAGRLFLYNGNERGEILGGRTTLAMREWHHVVLVREGERVRVHLDGRMEPEMEGLWGHSVPEGVGSVFFGGRNDGMFGLEGKLDEITVHSRALKPAEIAKLYEASALTPPVRVPTLDVFEPPLEAEESLKKIHVRRGYTVELMASEPLVLDPVAIDWDGSGRLWVVEMPDYPMGMDGAGKPGGRVRVLDDTNDDGRLDKSKVFADNLNFPTGLLVWRDGVIVTAAPEILFLRDTDGDGVADERTVLVSGLGTGNEQLRANGLRWGMDGWVYCAAGGHHGGHGAGTVLRTQKGSVPVGSRDFRFKPDTGELEPESGPSQFGRNRDDWGQWFGTQNSRALWHYVLPDRYLRRNPHIPAPDPTRLLVTPLNAPVWPASSPEKRFHSFENTGHFTSACSGMIYRDNLLFPIVLGRQHAFTCEPFHNLVQHNEVIDADLTFTARRDPADDVTDFFASEDRWCRPVMIRTGPDGALWVVDMYRYIIEHPEWLPAAGRDELLPHFRLGDDRGRIYRVVPEGNVSSRPRRLDTLSGLELVQELNSLNGWQRDHVHMRLLWQADREIVGPIGALFDSSPHPTTRVHCLWLLDQLKALTVERLVEALGDPHPGVRRNAVQIAESREDEEVREAVALRVDDPDMKVRLQVALTLGEWRSDEAGVALGRLAVMHAADPFLRAAIQSSAMPHLLALTDAILMAGVDVQMQWNESLAALALAMGDRRVLARIVEQVIVPADGVFTVERFVAAIQFADVVGRRPGGLKGLADGNDALGRLLTRALNDDTSGVFYAAKRVIADDRAPVVLRVAGARLMGRNPGWEERDGDALESLLNPRVPVELQMGAMAGLVVTGDSSVSVRLLRKISELSPSSQRAGLDALLSRESWAMALLEQQEQVGEVVPIDSTRRAQLLHHGSSGVRELAAKVLSMPSERAAVVGAYQPALRLAGDLGRGKKVFERACINCHSMGGGGGTIGPDLISVMSHEPEKLLVNILDPGADIQPGYHMYQCELNDGTELQGRVVSETGNSLTLQTVDGVGHVILRGDIRSIRGSNRSVMPDGLESDLSQQDMADVIQWIRKGRNGT